MVEKTTLLCYILNRGGRRTRQMRIRTIFTLFLFSSFFMHSAAGSACLMRGPAMACCPVKTKNSAKKCHESASDKQKPGKKPFICCAGARAFVGQDFLFLGKKPGILFWPVLLSAFNQPSDHNRSGVAEDFAAGSGPPAFHPFPFLTRAPPQIS